MFNLLHLSHILRWTGFQAITLLGKMSEWGDALITIRRLLEKIKLAQKPKNTMFRNGILSTVIR